MKNTTKNKPSEKTQAELADDYGVTERTIRAWERADAPLADPKQMVRWIRDRRRGSEPATQFPDGLDHANILRYVAEHAAAHFLPDALEHIAEPIAQMLAEDDGMAPHKARGTVILLHHMLLQALHNWTSEGRFERHLKRSEGMDYDSMLHRLVPDYRDRSVPTEAGYLYPAGPKLSRLYEQNGGGEILNRMGVAPTDGQPSKRRRGAVVA